MSDAAIPPLPKLDPESLAIRTKPARAIRFRKGVIIAIAALGSASLMVVAWIALKPRVFSTIADRQELSEPSNRPSSDALNQLPSSYAAVPKLGPPLPGDLGRPILASERALAVQDPSARAENTTADLARLERERSLAERTAARQSGLIFQQGQSRPDQIAQAVDAPTGAPTPPASVPPVSGGVDPNGQGHKVAFVAKVDGGDAVNPHMPKPAPSPYVLAAGSVISASLITGLRSDLPGIVIAQVTSRVFDSPTGRILLVPQGARLVGNYDSVVAFGQKRALVVWKRILMPDGSSLALDNEPATDPAGYAGLADRIDFHSWSLLKGIAMSTLVGIGSSLTLSGGGDLVRALRQSTQDASAHAGEQITGRNLDVQPTITIRPGTPVRLVVHKDLILSPWPE